MTLKTEVSVTINRPPAGVFAVLADVPHQPDWSKGVRKVRDVSEDPVRLGTTWTQINPLMGKEIEAHATVNVYEADRKLGFAIDKPFPAHGLFLLEPSGSGTKLTFSMEGEPGGFFGVAAPLLKKALTDSMSGDLGNLKARLEAKG
jgi:uncharacterized membrane protein